MITQAKYRLKATVCNEVIESHTDACLMGSVESVEGFGWPAHYAWSYDVWCGARGKTLNLLDRTHNIVFTELPS